MNSLSNNLFYNTYKGRKIIFLLKRLKNTSKFNNDGPKERALSHFDDFYKALFLDRWPSIRLGLLSRQKYVAVLNNFGDVKSNEEFLQSKGALDFFNFLQVQKTYADEADSEKPSQADEKGNLQDIIEAKMQQTELKELSELHPEAEEFQQKADLLREEAGKGDAPDGPLYSPEDARTSMHADLLSSQIDSSRIIEPGSPMAQGNLQEFVPATVLRGFEEYVPESEYYKYYQTRTETPITVEKEFDLDIPEKLKAYTFDRGDISEFPEPFKGVHDVYGYLAVEGADLLSALALGVRPEDKVLDLCSFSGSIAYCIFQTLRPSILVCVAGGRQDTEKLFRGYLYDFSPFWRQMLMITNKQLVSDQNYEMFDKVLVNVPSTQDKHSVLETTKNIFQPRRVRERLRLPELQCELLVNALKMVRPGGTVLYTTSTLSPVQNEGVVTAALTSVWEADRTEFVVKDLNPALKHMAFFYNFDDCLGMKYGTLVVPFTPVNFGPKYLCKLVKKAKE